VTDATFSRLVDLLIKAAPRVLHRPLRQHADRVGASSFASRLVRGSFWSLVGSVVSRALSLAAAILAARILGKAAYGELGVIQNTLGMFGTLAGFGMGITATKGVAEFRLKDPARAGRVIALSSLASWTMSGVLAIVMIFMAPWLSSNVLAAPHLTGYLQISALLLLLNGVNGAQNGVLAGFESFKTLAKVNSLAGVLNFPLVVGGAQLFGLPGVVWGLVMSQAAGSLMSFYCIRLEAKRHRVPMTYRSWTTEVSLVWHFSIPAVLGSLMIGPVTWFGSAMLVRQPHGYDHMGAFNAANQWFSALMWLPYVIGGVALPLLAEQVSTGDKARSMHLLIKSIKTNAVIALPLVAAGCLLSPYIMLAYGPTFRAEWPTLIATLLSAGALAVQIPVGWLIAASGRMWTGFLLNVGWSVVFIGSAWLLLGWGALGLASAQLLAYGAQGICAFAYASFLLRSEVAPAA
jgi:O-antigen/teichoic acid export membrane protein